MRIGELAARTGVTVRALRYYEERALLRPRRSPGGHRYYEASDVDRVILIQELYAAGLHSERITQLVPMLDGGTQTDASRARAILALERRHLRQHVRETYRSLNVLSEIIDRLTHRAAREADMEE